MIRFFVIPLVVLIVGTTFAEEREWTDVQGRTTRATLVKVEGGKAILRLGDGREAAFPLEKLSKADQEYVEGLEDAGKGDAEQGGNVAVDFDGEWPERVRFEEDPEIVMVEENAEIKKFVYESANYRYTCDVRLANSVVKGFALMFETTHEYVRQLPLGLSGGVKTDGKYSILLFENYDDYISAGGIPKSAGVYTSRGNLVMVPLTSLGVRKVGSGYMLDRDKSSKTLPHELVHQLTPIPYYSKGSRSWFTEGIAEYVAVTPYSHRAFHVKTNFRPILEFVTGYGKDDMGGRALGKDIRLGSLEAYMTQSPEDFFANAPINYGSALLITYYFFHMDREGDGARIKGFLKALKEGKQGQEALEVLLDGQTWLELEEAIAKAYSKRGVKFTFTK